MTQTVQRVIGDRIESALFLLVIFSVF